MRFDKYLKKLGDVSEVINGGTPKTKIKEYWGGDVAWITPADLGKLQSVEVYNTSRTITELGLDKSSAKLFPPDSVILSTRAPIGHLAINKVPMSTNQGCRGIIPHKGLETKYLYYFLLSNVRLLNELGTGTTFKELSSKNLSSVKIPVPPLLEQKQIVSILDKAFTSIDQAKTNIEKNIQNAEELFQSKLNEVFSQKGEGWEEKKLKEVCEIKPPKKLAREKLTDNELVSFVPMKELGVDQMYFSSDETRLLGKVYSGYVYFEENDVILAKITPCFENGKIGIAKDLKNGTGFGSSEYIVYRPVESTILPEFLYHFLNRESFRRKGKSLMTGAVGHKRIPVDFYEEEFIPFPDVESQSEICESIDMLQLSCSALKQQFASKLSSLDELKSSILQQAFSGELTSATEIIEQTESAL